MLGLPIIGGRLTLARAGATYWRSACPVRGAADRCMRQLAKPLYKVSRITSPRLIDIIRSPETRRPAQGGPAWQ